MLGAGVEAYLAYIFFYGSVDVRYHYVLIAYAEICRCIHIFVTHN